MSEIYVATAIETDGPIPGMCSILSLASAAYQNDQTLISSFSVNLERLPGVEGEPDTLAWWHSKPEAWDICRQDPELPSTAIPEYAQWLEHLPGRPVYVGCPAPACYAFVTWYLHRFAQRNPFGKGALDLRTMAMVLLGRPYHQSKTRCMPEDWTKDSPPPHLRRPRRRPLDRAAAVPDALGQPKTLPARLARRGSGSGFSAEAQRGLAVPRERQRNVTERIGLDRCRGVGLNHRVHRVHRVHRGRGGTEQGKEPGKRQRGVAYLHHIYLD